MFFFSLTYKIIIHFVLTSPLVVCFFLPICLLIKCEIKYTCTANSPWDDPFFILPFHCCLDSAQDSAD